MLYLGYTRQLPPTHKTAITRRWIWHTRIFSACLLGDATNPHLVSHYTGMTKFQMDEKLSISSSLTFILGQLNCLQTGHCLTLINKPKNPRMNKAGERNRIRERYMGDRIILENGSNRECSN